MQRKSGHQPTKPALLKRKRTVSEDEDEDFIYERPPKRNTCDHSLAAYSAAGTSDIYSPDVDSDLLSLFDVETENIENNPPLQEEAVQGEIDEDWIAADETLQEEVVDSDICPADESLQEEVVDSDICPADESLQEEVVDSETCPADESLQEEVVDSEICPADESFQEEVVCSETCPEDEMLQEVVVCSETCPEDETLQEEVICSETCPESNSAPSSELDSEGDIIQVTPLHPSWSQFRRMPFLLTPVTDRLSPLPVLTWANPKEVWELMCHKDEISTHERDEDMFAKHPTLQPRMRAILLDWLIEVCEVYKMHRETYHLTMDFIDRYLSIKREVHKQHLQLIGITCLFIAAKIEEIYPPKIGEFAFVTDGACSEGEILDMELVILKTLNWNLSPVTVNSWLNMYMQLCCDNRKRSREELPNQPDPSFVFPQYSGLAFVQTAQLVDLCMLDEGCLRFPYSVLAATSLYHTCSRELALYVSGLQWGDIATCVQWMSPFANIVREEGQNLVTASSVRQGSTTSDANASSSCGLLKSVPHIVVDDSHNIQTHIVDLQMLDKAKARQAEVQSHAETILSPEHSSNLLTPPSSSGKRLSEQKVTLAEGLT